MNEKYDSLQSIMRHHPKDHIHANNFINLVSYRAYMFMKFYDQLKALWEIQTILNSKITILFLVTTMQNLAIESDSHFGAY